MYEPKDKLAALETICAAIEADRPLPEVEAHWLATGLRAYIENEGADLDCELGLMPRQGGWAETPWQLRRRHDRDAAIHRAAEALSGPVWARAGKLEELIRAAEAGHPSTPEVVGMIQQFGDAVPRSKRQLGRILLGETISARR